MIKQNQKLILLFFVSLAVCLLPVKHARASSLAGTPSIGIITNGNINSIVSDANFAYVGGSFTKAGKYSDTSNGVVLDKSSDFVSEASPLITGGDVFASVSDGTGGFYIGGSFTQVGGLDTPYLAHILANGSVDSSWKPNPNGQINSLAFATSTIYVGGSFNNIGGTARNDIAEVNLSTGSSTPWNPISSGSPYITFIALATSTVYVGGVFDNMAGQPRKNIAGIDRSTGLATAWKMRYNKV